MFIKTANFLGSFTKIDQCPNADRPEYAFIGRSNVGKSSLVNLLTNNKNLAKVSQTPGKTQHINFFNMEDSWYLVDLPGYGYAKTSKTNRDKWDIMIRTYLKNRESLSCVFVLVDSRIPPQKIDMEFMSWLGANEIPFVVVLTKADKPKANELAKSFSAIKKAILAHFEALPQMFITSSAHKRGQEEIIDFIDQVNVDLLGGSEEVEVSDN